MGIETSAGLRAFVLSFRGHLFAAMSGSASVPFTIAAAFVENKLAQLLFFFCSLTCARLAAFRVWQPERERVMELEDKIRPKLALSFHPEAEGLVQTPIVIRGTKFQRSKLRTRCYASVLAHRDEPIPPLVANLVSFRHLLFGRLGVGERA